MDIKTNVKKRNSTFTKILITSDNIKINAYSKNINKKLKMIKLILK